MKRAGKARTDVTSEKRGKSSTLWLVKSAGKDCTVAGAGKAIKEVILKLLVIGQCLLFFNCISEGTWNFSEPKAVGLGKSPVMAMAVVRDTIWCSCGNKLYIVSHNEEVIKVFVHF